MNVGSMHEVNYLPRIDQTASITGCCSLIYPVEWDGQTFTFENKLFAKAKTRSLLHIPLDMNSVMRRVQEKIGMAGARSKQWVVLSTEISPWHAEHYFAVNKEVPGLEHVRLTGTFMTRVFEGPYHDARKWQDRLTEYVEAQGKEPVKTYFFYATCPSCAKAYGKNYVIGFEQVSV